MDSLVVDAESAVTQRLPVKKKTKGAGHGSNMERKKNKTNQKMNNNLIEEWTDIDEFGPILPPGTDVLRDKRAYQFVKRFFDLALSLFALIVLSPFLLIIALLIFIDDPHGSPIFIQTRVGKNNKEFKMYKFRSMVVNAEELLAELIAQGKNIKTDPNDPTYKMEEDPRITRVGCFIRKTSIDELLQLINIIKGDMSIVGPRPALPHEVARYNTFSKQRLLVKQGLTCYWQTTQRRDHVPFKDWMKMDVRYVHNCSLKEDVKLIFKTFKVIFTADGN